MSLNHRASSQKILTYSLLWPTVSTLARLVAPACPQLLARLITLTRPILPQMTSLLWFCGSNSYKNQEKPKPRLITLSLSLSVCSPFHPVRFSDALSLRTASVQDSTPGTLVSRTRSRDRRGWDVTKRDQHRAR